MCGRRATGEKGGKGRARGEREEREERFAPDPRRAVGHAQRRSPVLGRVRARGKGEQGDGYGCRVGSSGGREIGRKRGFELNDEKTF